MLDLKLARLVGINEALGGAVYLRVDGLRQPVNIEHFVSFLVDIPERGAIPALWL